MKTISIPVHNRPDCLRAVIASIRECPTWRDWKIVFSCEPPIRETIEQLTITVPNALVSRNFTPLGCWENTFHAASIAMSLNPSVNLYLEDDYLITPDTLTMIDQWVNAQKYGVLCLRRPHVVQDNKSPNKVQRFTTGLFGCGFAWTANIWPIIRKAWFAADHNGAYTMWDISMASELNFEHLNIPQWRPMVNRSHGIGLVGTHTFGSGADLNLFGPAYDGPPVTNFIFE